MKKYYLNNKQVKYELFSYYLLKVSKIIVMKENISDINDIKEAKKVYYDLYNNMLENGVSYDIDKINFKIEVE